MLESLGRLLEFVHSKRARIGNMSSGDVLVSHGVVWISNLEYSSFYVRGSHVGSTEYSAPE